MGPLSSVQSLVGLQAVRVPQWFSAVAAEETSPGVGKHVPPELRFLGETLVALCARVRLLSVVNSQMALEVPWDTGRQTEIRLVDGGGRGGSGGRARWICICPIMCEDQVLSQNWCCHFDKWKHKLHQLITAGDALSVLEQLLKSVVENNQVKLTHQSKNMFSVFYN